MPSFSTSDRFEYPAITALNHPLPSSTVLYRPLPPLIHHPPDPPDAVVGDVDRPIRPLGDADRAVFGPALLLAPEAIRERLVGACRLAVLEGHERDAEALLRERSAVPRAVEGDERPPAVALGELRARVEQQAVRRPMRGEGDRGLFLLRAQPDLLAVAAVFRGEHEMVELGIVVAVRPAEVVSLLDAQQLFGGL